MRQRGSWRTPEVGPAEGASLLGGVGLGLALMYFMDPAQGRRRRSRVRLGARDAVRAGGHGVTGGALALRQRGGELASSAGRRIRREAPPDEVVLARVRAAILRLALHPGLVASHVDGGRVTLEGTVLAGERRRLVKAIRKARGVRRVADHLTEQSATGEAEAAADPAPPRPRVTSRRWLTRAACFTAGAACGAVAVYALQEE